MINYKSGNLLKEETEAIVNTVNCVGVMGRGIALQFKKKYPENFKKYEIACKHKQIIPGKMFIFEIPSLINPKYIINFPTKRHWKGKSRIEDIEQGLKDLVQIIQAKKIKSIALPPLGCGLGGLHWPKVKMLIEKYLSSLNNVDIVIFEPTGTPKAETMDKTSKIPKMTPGKAALIGLIHSYLNGLLDPFITLIEVHKLMYFMQETGHELKLNYTKDLYGPYAENLRHVLTLLEGHYISGYADGGDIPNKQLKLLPGAIEKASDVLKNHPDTKKHLQKVIDLVDGFESPYGLELLSTVHWIAKKEKKFELDDIVNTFYEWNNRKKQFKKEQINISIEVLKSKSWI